MFGIQEILIIIAIIVGILFIPRMASKKTPQPPPKLKIGLSGRMRVALAVSVIYPVVIAAYLQAWQKDQILFLYVGVGPVFLGWLLFWVLLGYKKK